MKIIQFMASQKWGGAEKVFVEISNELANDHEVVVLLLRDTEYRSSFSDKVDVVILKSHPTRYNPLLLWDLYKVIKKIEADIVHTHAAKASELVHTLNRFIDCRHIGTKHNARKGKIFNCLKWVTVVSKDAKESVKSRRGGVVRIINNGVIPEKTKFFSKNEKFDVLAIGRLDKIKGFDILIDQIVSSQIECNLSIVGKGEEKQSLFRKIDKLGVNNWIYLTGYSDDIPNLMKKSDLIVISSYSEGFPKVLVESLFYGNVLISTPVGGVKEILPQEFLVEQYQLGGKIREVQENYNHYFESFKKLKKNRAKFFSLDKIVKQYESIYMEMMK